MISFILKRGVKMIDLTKAMDFKAYLNKCSDINREKLLKAFKATELSKDALEESRTIKEKVNVVVFSEDYCPDCIVTLPFVERIGEVNENIKVYYYGLADNKELLQQYTGTARIPTVMTFSENMEPKGVYVEVPSEVSEKLAHLSPDKQKTVIQDYRQGKFNNFIEKDILSIINK